MPKAAAVSKCRKVCCCFYFMRFFSCYALRMRRVSGIPHCKEVYKDAEY